MSRVHVAKPTNHLISISSGPWALLMKLGSFVPMQQNVADMINQRKQRSKLVTTLVYFRRWLSFKTYTELEMWASAQRDGRPAEYRWRPLFNFAKFG